MGKIYRLAAGVLLGFLSSSAFASSPDTQPAGRDEFIAGYASAVLEHDFHLTPTTLNVKDGNVVVANPDLSAVEKASIRETLLQVKGVHSVTFAEPVVTPPGASNPEVPAASSTTPSTSAGSASGGSSSSSSSSAVGETPAPSTTIEAPSETDLPVLEPQGSVTTALSPHPWTFLAATSVFDPILADPRWPNFSAAYHNYIGRAQDNGRGQLDRDAGDVSFGDSLSLFQFAPDPAAQLELGVQAGLFADFDLDQNSVDLINADYFVGPEVSYRRGDFSTIFRFFHQSSHLGDNYLLNNPGVHRFELTYEQPNILFSYDLFRKTVRLYGGGGYLVDVDPSTLKRGIFEYGVELTGAPIGDTSTVPVLAADFQNRQENDWSGDISARVGLQFNNRSTFGRRLDLMLEYYNGHSPNGQFFLQKIQSLGIGLHFYL